MYRHHQFSGDPHPGNCLLLDDGRMAFLDFGLFKRITAEVGRVRAAEPAARDRAPRRASSSSTCTAAAGSATPATTPRTGSSSSSTTSPGGTRATRRSSSTPEIATEVMIQMSDPRSRHFGKMRHETLPPDHLFGRRLEMLTLAVIGPAARDGQLAPHRARVDLRRRAGHRARARRGRVLRAPPAARGVKASGAATCAALGGPRPPAPGTCSSSPACRSAARR